MIAPEVLDILAERISAFSPEQIEEKLNDIQSKQPSVFAYLMSDNETYLFSETEKELLYYLAIVVWEAIKQELIIPQRLSMKRVDEIQFSNWRILETYSNPKGQPLDDFFEPVIGYHEQAELLYFVCDGLEEAEEEQKIIAKDSLLPMFVMLKTLVDTMLDAPE